MLRLLGQGGMASVFLVEHEFMGRRFALKLLDDQLSRNDAVVTRFINEGKTIAKLDHPNIIGIHDIARVPETGAVYLVLEYLEGESLAHHLASRNRLLSPVEIVRLFGGPASALMRAHREGAIHRDIKPDNLFVTRDRVKVLDFGVAQLSENIATGPGTRTGTLIGTPTYMSPEQLSGLRVTPESDTFALALTMYEAATGCLPFQQRDETRMVFFQRPEGEILYRMRTSPPIDVRERNPGFPDAAGAALMAGLSLAPADRGPIGPFVGTFAARVGEDGIEALRDVAPDLVPRSEAVTAGRKVPEVVASNSKADSRYDLRERLGAGGMAEVFLAEQRGDAGFKRVVALKRILPSYANDAQFYTMFLSEAQLVSSLRHPNIVNVSDFARDEKGNPFLVMDYVHGKNLDELMSAGPIPPPLSIWLVIEVLRGIDYAHNATDRATRQPLGMLHRDLKPHNVLLGYEGNVIVADFGLAKMMSISGKALSVSVKGTPQYMAPEQVRGKELDRTTDLWAVGVMLWEMLAGRALFDGMPAEIMGHVMFTPIERPSIVGRERGLDVPLDVDAVVMKMLSRERSERYQTADQVIEALLACDVSRNGRGELIRLMAERFADSPARQRSSIPPTSRPTPSQSPGAYAAGSAAPLNPSTLSSAASQPMRVPSSPPKRSRVALYAVTGVAVVGLGMGGAFLIVRASNKNKYAASEPHDANAVAETTNGIVATPSMDARSAMATVPSDAAPLPDSATAMVPADAAIAAVVSDAALPTDGSTANAPIDAAPHDAKPVASAAKGWIVISVTAPDTNLYVDGTLVGQSAIRLKATAGMHTVMLVNGEKRETIKVNVKANKSTVIERQW